MKTKTKTIIMVVVIILFVWVVRLECHPVYEYNVIKEITTEIASFASGGTTKASTLDEFKLASKFASSEGVLEHLLTVAANANFEDSLSKLGLGNSKILNASEDGLNYSLKCEELVREDSLDWHDSIRLTLSLDGDGRDSYATSLIRVSESGSDPYSSDVTTYLSTYYGLNISNSDIRDALKLAKSKGVINTVISKQDDTLKSLSIEYEPASETGSEDGGYFNIKPSMIF